MDYNILTTHKIHKGDIVALAIVTDEENENRINGDFYHPVYVKFLNIDGEIETPNLGEQEIIDDLYNEMCGYADFLNKNNYFDKKVSIVS